MPRARAKDGKPWACCGISAAGTFQLSRRMTCCRSAGAGCVLGLPLSGLDSGTAVHIWSCRPSDRSPTPRPSRCEWRATPRVGVTTAPSPFRSPDHEADQHPVTPCTASVPWACRVRERRPGRLWLEFTTGDPLNEIVPALPVPDVVERDRTRRSPRAGAAPEQLRENGVPEHLVQMATAVYAWLTAAAWRGWVGGCTCSASAATSSRSRAATPRRR
jgi:hypothetical protein